MSAKNSLTYSCQYYLQKCLIENTEYWIWKRYFFIVRIPDIFHVTLNVFRSQSFCPFLRLLDAYIVYHHYGCSQAHSEHIEVEVLI